jgi:hypothetical protein
MPTPSPNRFSTAPGLAPITGHLLCWLALTPPWPPRRPPPARRSVTAVPTAAAMVAAYFDRYDRTGPLEDPEPVCLAAALRAMPPGADLAAVIDALEVMG